MTTMENALQYVGFSKSNKLLLKPNPESWIILYLLVYFKFLLKFLYAILHFLGSIITDVIDSSTEYSYQGLFENALLNLNISFNKG